MGQLYIPEVEIFSDFGSQGPQEAHSEGAVTGSVKIRMSKRTAHTFPSCRSLVDTILSTSEAREGAVSYARSGNISRIRLGGDLNA